MQAFARVWAKCLGLCHLFETVRNEACVRKSLRRPRCVRITADMPTAGAFDVLKQLVWTLFDRLHGDSEKFIFSKSLHRGKFHILGACAKGSICRFAHFPLGTLRWTFEDNGWCMMVGCFGWFVSFKSCRTMQKLRDLTCIRSQIRS